MKQHTSKLDSREVGTLYQLLGEKLHRAKTAEDRRFARNELALYLRLAAVDKADDPAGLMWESTPAWADELLWSALKAAERIPALETRAKQVESEVKSLKGKLAQRTAHPKQHKAANGKAASNVSKPAAPRVAAKSHTPTSPSSLDQGSTAMPAPSPAATSPV